MPKINNAIVKIMLLNVFIYLFYFILTLNAKLVPMKNKNTTTNCIPNNYKYFLEIEP
ncbi:Uncharacterised protein [Sphingobacterium daejeonense]|nr:Uncharacterised protein [Sphingobacterium daejeonense]